MQKNIVSSLGLQVKILTQIESLFEVFFNFESISWVNIIVKVNLKQPPGCMYNLYSN